LTLVPKLYLLASSRWHVEAGNELLRFEGHTRPVHRVAFAVDGRFALSGGADHTLRLWGMPE
jgi:WD40 repeat protein